MKIYAINLARAAARRAHIERECARYALPVEIFPAADGAALTAEEIAATVEPRARELLTAGEIGCALSHWRLYQKIVAEKIPAALILEDDAKFILDPRPLLAAFAAPVEDGVYLLTKRGSQFKRRPRQLAGNAFYPLIFDFGAHGYVITQNAARALTAFLSPIRMRADMWKYMVINGAARVFGPATAVIGLDEPLAAHSSLEKERNVEQENKDRQLYFFLCGLMPWRRKIKYYLWKTFVKPWLPVVKQ
ncbi:MAG: glycosyltransferase family 25 protein [Planctomycetota bacterium]|nr:glycosyltransferase family 25 protein [Planctomycetota bacterium]